ncbi:DUF3667 domain-containing protein [Undibacterium sp. TS12]|uniref:DUF3667 domain-containing protein n=1 Tax=Undibacterium sp. TS12 TaxID=2908202 RepID=UPI001F4CD600|nr:DUF3667 domain-containing protein [Undibacterium sp. TS12]MCH8619257.1 DUF3667 domain-containing protein [Undibacterium sp. TS12]
MSVEIATDVMEQAVLVHEFEQGGSPGNAHQEHHQCANCKVELQGAYCHNCGQSAHIHRSLLHLIEELLHGLFHFETKAWRTIPALIFRPGKLTRDYIEGQRTRYVSPLALFLFLIFLMFFVFSFTGNDPFNSISDHPTTKVGISKALQENREKLAALQIERGKLLPEDSKAENLDDDINDLKTEIQTLETVLAHVDDKNNVPTSTKTDEDNTGVNTLTKKLDQKLSEKSAISSYPAIEKKVRHALKTPELTLYKIKSNSSKFAFLLMPISLPFLWLLFIFKRKYGMFDHAVFSLYSLCFMSLLLMSSAILNYSGFTATAALMVVFMAPLHMFMQLRSAYQLGIAASLWRTVALLMVAGCSLGLYVLLIIGLST